MELLVTLHKKENFKEICKLDIAGVIFGSLFSHGYHLSLEELVEINDQCIKYNLKRYVSINSLIKESDLEQLDAYIDLLKQLDVDGIYFSDFAVANKAYAKDIQSKLIYDPYNLNTNEKDIAFFSEYNIPSVLSRELTLEEMKNIVKSRPYLCDVQIFGHLRISESRREFISNYFRNFNINENPKNKETYSIKEQSRDYKMPIMEDAYGTCIYTDYVYAMFTELHELYRYVNHAIIDDIFVSPELVNEYVRNLEKVNKENEEIIKESIKKNHPNVGLSTGYLYQKTTDVKVKDEQD